MSNTNQLIHKAMSTSSEEEAIACLRMARKKGAGSYTPSDGRYKGENAEYWYNKAASWYTEAQMLRKDPGLSKEQISTLYNMYNNAAEERSKLKLKVIELEKKVLVLSKTKPVHWTYSIIALQTILILIMIQFI